ncbi:hypothetical protein [Paremcibacter congregatus]|uniref:hypothetical protein n=1 Tax=Paremcibacter congregatus TaxID=2043170 RepID=UPI0030EDAF70
MPEQWVTPGQNLTKLQDGLITVKRRESLRIMMAPTGNIIHKKYKEGSVMKTLFISVLGVSLIMFLTGCDQGPKSARGFSLPEGSVVNGEIKFVQLKCNDCHSVVGREEIREDVDPIMTVPLGGMTTRIVTYGELVTSIINPSHKISQRYLATPVEEEGQSKMRNYNELMTVQELIDIVAFLSEQYELQPYPKTYYTVY